jgi:hypothetical protein
MISGIYTYPYLFHWLWSLAPERLIWVVEQYSSALIDALLVMVSYLLTRQLLPAFGWNDETRTVATWTSLLLSFSPALLSAAGGPRAYHGTPRTLTQLLFLAFMGALLLYAGEPHPRYLLAASAAVVPLAIASKFGNQALVFISAWLLVAGYWSPALAAAAGYLAAALITRGRVLEVLRGQWRHSAFYARHLQARYLHSGHVTLRQYARDLGTALRGPRALAEWLVSSRFHPHQIACAFPHLPGCLLLAWQHWADGGLPGIPAALAHVLASWSAAALLVTVAISFRPLLFLGEPERYLEISLFPQVLLFVLLSCTLPWVAGLALVYSLASYALAMQSFRRTFAPWCRVKQDLLPLVTRNDGEGRKFYGVGTLFWPLLFGTDKAQVMCYSGNLDEGQVSPADWDLAFGNFPLPGRPMGEVVDRFGITHLVGSVESLAAYGKMFGDGFFSSPRARLIDRQGEFLVYEVVNAVRHDARHDHLSNESPASLSTEQFPEQPSEASAS